MTYQLTTHYPSHIIAHEMTNVTLTLSLSEEPLNYHCVQVWLKSDQYCRRSSESFNLFFWFQQEKCKKLFLFFSSFKTIWFSLWPRYFLITLAACCRAIVKHICIKKKKKKPEVLYLKQNTETTEDDTLMGTDVCFNVIYRLKGV